jgi:hypothetical protein
MRKKARARCRQSASRAPRLECLEERDLLSGGAPLGSPPQGPPAANRVDLRQNSGDSYSELGIQAGGPGRDDKTTMDVTDGTKGRSDPTDESYGLNAMSPASRTASSENNGEAVTGYAASSYPRMETPATAVVVVALSQIQPAPAGPAPAQAAPVTTSRATVALEPPTEIKMRAAAVPAATRSEMPPRPPARPDQHSGEWQSGLPALIAEDSLEHVIQGRPDALQRDQTTNSSPTVGPVLAGLLPLDRAALARAVDEFFDRVQRLGEELTANGIGSRLAPLLTGAAVATAAYAFARHRLRPPLPAGVAKDDDGRDLEWAWFTDCAVLPPWDKP